MHVNWKPGGAPGRLARAVRPPRRRDPPSPRELPRRGWPPPGPWSQPHGSAIALTALQSAWWPAHRGRVGPGAALVARHTTPWWRGAAGARARLVGCRAQRHQSKLVSMRAPARRRRPACSSAGAFRSGGSGSVARCCTAAVLRARGQVGGLGTGGPRQGSHCRPTRPPRVTAARSRPRAPAAPRGTRPARAARPGARPAQADMRPPPNVGAQHRANRR
jgi:hypothetical protein